MQAWNNRSNGVQMFDKRRSMTEIAQKLNWKVSVLVQGKQPFIAILMRKLKSIIIGFRQTAIS
jgi:hypothetical protein